MSVALFSTLTRLGLALAAIMFVVLAVWLFRRRRPVRGAAAGVLALGMVGALAAEGMVAIAVHFGAPSGVDFNEHRWVMLAPWGRFTLLLGGVATVAIIALSWRATRQLSAGIAPPSSGYDPARRLRRLSCLLSRRSSFAKWRENRTELPFLSTIHFRWRCAKLLGKRLASHG